jgi:hypothetical protein
MNESYAIHFSSFSSAHTALSTDFLVRYVAGEKRHDKNSYTPTVFDNYSTHFTTKDGNKLNIGLWDSAGQSEYSILRRSLYGHVNVFVCLFNLADRKELEVLKNDFLSEMNEISPEAKFVIVGCFPEIREKKLFEKSFGINNLTNGEETEVVTPNYARKIIHDFACDHHLNREGKRIDYIEYSLQYSFGMTNVIELACEMLLLDEKVKQSKRKRGSFIPSIPNPFKALMSVGQKVSPSTTTSTPFDSFRASLSQLESDLTKQLDYWYGPIDEKLLQSQFDLLNSQRTIGVSAAAFTSLRLLFCLHSDNTTTGTVVYECVIPSTKALKCPFFYYLLGRRDTSHEPFVGAATKFLSHAWNCPFSLLEEGAKESSMLSFYTEHYGQWPFYWCDVFIKNQHYQAPSDEEFLRAIGDVNGTIGVLNTLVDPIPLTRIWCLFEYFQSVRLEKTVRFYVPLVRSRKSSGGGGGSELTLKAVDIRESSATVMQDKERILGEIEQLVGIDELNRILNELITKGYSTALEEAEYRQNFYRRFEVLLGR